MSVIKQHLEAPDGAKLILKGEVDMHTSNGLRAELLGLLKKRPQKVVLDMAEVSYIDSAGLGTLIEATKAFAAQGGTLALARVQKRVSDEIRLAHLHVFFKFEPV